MLEFNPHLRWSTKECINSPYFDGVRIPSLEKKSKRAIILDEESYSLEELKETIKVEALKFKKHD